MRLASSRGTSNGPDWRDLAEMLTAFEEQNRVTIEICISKLLDSQLPDLRVIGKAWELAVDRRVVKPLASVSVVCRAERIRTLEGLVTFLLYQLDFQLAENDWGAGKNHSA